MLGPVHHNFIDRWSLGLDKKRPELPEHVLHVRESCSACCLGTARSASLRATTSSATPRPELASLQKSHRATHLPSQAFMQIDDIDVSETPTPFVDSAPHNAADSPRTPLRPLKGKGKGKGKAQNSDGLGLACISNSRLWLHRPWWARASLSESPHEPARLEMPDVCLPSILLNLSTPSAQFESGTCNERVPRSRPCPPGIHRQQQNGQLLLRSRGRGPPCLAARGVLPPPGTLWESDIFESIGFQWQFSRATL